MQLFSRRKRRIEGPVVDLVFDRRYKGTEGSGEKENIWYSIVLHGDDVPIGQCDLRVGMNDELLYAGNIGYRIYEPYRGHSFAYQAALLLLEEARSEYGMKELLITVSPGNTASERTLQKLNGEKVATLEVPKEHWLYKRGETVKHIYRFNLQEEDDLL